MADSAQALLDRWQTPGTRSFRAAGIAGIAGTAAGLVASLAVASLVARAVDDPGRSFRPGGWLVVLVAALAAQAAATALSRHLSARGARRVIAGIHAELLDRLLRKDQPLSRPDRHGAGATAVALLDEVDELAAYHARCPALRLQVAVAPLLCLAAVTLISPTVALLLLAATPLVPLYGWLTGAGAARLAREHAESSRTSTVRYHEALVGLPTLVGLGVADEEADRLDEASRQTAGQAVEVLRRAFVTSAVLELVATVSLGLVAGYVGLTLLGYLHLDWLPGDIDLRTGLFALLVTPAFFASLRTYAASYHERTDAEAVAAQVDAALPAAPAAAPPANTGGAGTNDAEPDEPAAPAAPVAAAPAPAVASVATRPARTTRQARRRVGSARPVDVRVDELSVSYPGHGAPALDDVDLSAPAGTTVVVTGPSGAGKSTLLAAIAGEVGPMTCGQVLWNRIDVDEVPVAFRRATIGWLRQKPYVFPASVEDNVDLDRTHDHAAVVRVCEQAGLDADEAALRRPALALSGGQRQRIAIARLLLRDARVVLLDEPTAHLDPDSEAELLPALEALAAGRTCVVATHSTGLASLADAVIHLDAGRALPPDDAHSMELAPQ